MVYLCESRVPGTRVQARRRHDAEAPRAATLRRRGRSFGRLVVVACLVVSGTVHAASNVVQYTHDAAGNIVAIRRVDPSPITIAGFTPPSGPAGTVVTITGTGLDATANGNAVTFGGVASTVVAATVTALTVVVPTGAATGRIAVTVAANTATSAQDFVVAASGLPTITGFTPAAGPSGTAVTVSGTNFNAAPGATTIKLNRNAATASSVTTTQLAFVVPAATGSGRIGLVTSTGSAVSATDFIVPPGSIAASDIIATARLAADGPERSLSLLATGKYGIVLFDGNPGDWLSLHVRNFAVNPSNAPIAYTIYKPDNTLLASGTLTAAKLSIHLPVLPTAGTYTVLLGTGIAQVALDARLESNAVIPPDGSLAIARSAGQSTRLLIAAVAGDQQALQVSGLVTVPANGSLPWTIVPPKGSSFFGGNAFGLGATTQLPPFTQSGTHTVLFTPYPASAQVTFRVGFAAAAPLLLDGAPTDQAIVNPGDGPRLTFAGTAGQTLGLGITGLVLSPSSVTFAKITVYGPDGVTLLYTNCYVDGRQCGINLPRLPVTGTYSIIAQPASGATGSLTAWLSRDAAGTLSSGTPLRVVLARPGQNARLSFEGAAGALIAVQVRDIQTSPAAQSLFVAINRPDGSKLTSIFATGAGQILVAPPLPVAGTYTVVLEPEPGAKGVATASMEVLLDPGQDLAMDGPTSNTAIALAGGSARYTFAGVAGQKLGLGVSNLVLNPKVGATVHLHGPDGAELASFTCAASASGCGSNLSLRSTGTYGIVVRPSAGATGGVGVTLSSDFGGALVVSGPALPVSLDRPGRNARLTIAGVAGQTLRLSWSSVAISGPPGSASATVTTPSGSALGGFSIANATAGSYDIPVLPATGDYTLFIDPAAGATLSATFALVAR